MAGVPGRGLVAVKAVRVQDPSPARTGTSILPRAGRKVERPVFARRGEVVIDPESRAATAWSRRGAGFPPRAGQLSREDEDGFRLVRQDDLQNGANPPVERSTFWCPYHSRTISNKTPFRKR